MIFSKYSYSRPLWYLTSPMPPDTVWTVWISDIFSYTWYPGLHLNVTLLNVKRILDFVKLHLFIPILSSIHQGCSGCICIVWTWRFWWILTLFGLGGGVPFFWPPLNWKIILSDFPKYTPRPFYDDKIYRQQKYYGGEKNFQIL